MAYRFECDETVEAGVRRIAGEQLDEILAEFDDPSLSVSQRVHSARKHCKKVRGLLRLVRPGLGKAYRQENDAVRDAGRVLSAMRDSQTRLDAFNKLAAQSATELGSSTGAEIRQGLEQRRDEAIGEEADAVHRLGEFRAAIATTRGRVEQWRLSGDGGSIVRRGMKQVYARGREALAEAYDDPSPVRFHEWRKWVKHYWTHLLLLEGLWPAVLKATSDEAKRLSDLLGDDHDLAVLSEELQSAPADFGGPAAVAAFVAMSNRRRELLEAEARVLGGRLYEARPGATARRLKFLWRAWKAGGRNAR